MKNKKAKTNNFTNLIFTLSIILITIFILLNAIINLITVIKLNTDFHKEKLIYVDDILAYKNSNNENIVISKIYDTKNNEIDLGNFNHTSKYIIYCNNDDSSSGIYFNSLSPLLKTILYFVGTLFGIFFTVILILKKTIKKKNKSL